MTETNRTPDERLLDDLLDASLARYAQAEPRAGLEQRMLAGLRAAPEHAGWSWRWLPVAAAAVLAFAAALYFVRGREATAPQIAVQPRSTVAPIVTAPQAPQRATVSPVPRTRPQAPAPRVQARAAAPRREQFFRPSAMSEQETALVRFVNQAPPEELKLLARPERAEPIASLKVEQLEISPVVIGENDSQ